MATTGTTNYNRTVLILVKGGTKLTRKLFEKRVKDLSPEGQELTIDDFLLQHKSTILQDITGINRRKLFFPTTSAKIDIENWDLNMFCFVLDKTCDLSSALRLNVRTLQKLRNKLLHMNDVTLEGSRYKMYMELIDICFEKCLDAINDADFSAELNCFVNSVKNGPNAFEDTIKIMHAFYITGIEQKQILEKHVKEWMQQRHIDRFSEDSSGFGDDTDGRVSPSSDSDEPSEDTLVEKIEEFIKETNVQLTINKEDIQGHVKQFKHSIQSSSGLLMIEMIKDIFKQKGSTEAEQSEENLAVAGVLAATPLNENLQIKKEIISPSKYLAVENDNDDFKYNGGTQTSLFGQEQNQRGTPLKENQQIQTEIKSSPNYRAVGDDDEEFECQGGKGASKQDIVTELNQEYFDCPGDEEWMSFLYSGKKKVAKRLLELGHLPKQRILNEICLLFGRKSKVTIMICDAICVHIKSKNEHIIDVWAAYTLQNMNSITFVVSLEEFENTGRDDQAESIRIDKMIDYSFIKRIVRKYSYESTEIMNHNVTSGEDYDDDAYCKLQTCVAKYSVELMKQHKYLSIVSACSKRSTGYGPSLNLKPENCIVLYVHTKHYIPINEDPFKTHYDEIPVDVREGVFIRFGRTATDFLDHVQMGCQIRGEVENGQYVEGTLGCFIDHPQYGVVLSTGRYMICKGQFTSLQTKLTILAIPFS